MSTSLRLSLRGFAALVSVFVLTGSAAAQTKTAPLDKELASLMDQQKLDSLAGKGADDQFVAALYMPGAQLLVISAKYAAPAALQEMIDQKTYQEVYRELQSASIRESRMFITDLGADGLRPRPEGGAGFDSVMADTARVSFNGDWRQQKLTEADYQKRFGEADEGYASMLTVLLGALKK
jgi:hypothetical protein